MKHLLAYPVYERKQVGIIYHFTPIQNVESILSDGYLMSSFPYVSFTRDYNLRYGGAEVRLTFDGTRLSDFHHIAPYAYSGENHYGDKTEINNEEEERIMGYDVRFKDALLAVDFLDTRPRIQAIIDRFAEKGVESTLPLRDMREFNETVAFVREKFPHVQCNIVNRFTPYKASGSAFDAVPLASI